MNKSNILIVTRNLPPLVGGMERLIWHVIDELLPDYEVHVIGPSGCRHKLPEDVNVIEVKIRPMFLFFLEATLGALWSAIRYRPTVVFAGSGLTAPIVWFMARLLRSRCIVYLHGLDVRAQHPLYRLLWVPFFRYFDSVLVNSHYTKKLAMEENVSLNRITILHPGVEIPDMAAAEKRDCAFRSRYNLGKAPVMLYVGRITPRKGLLRFVEDILPHILSTVPESVLVVIGDDPINALQNPTDERQRICSALKEKELESKVYFLGSCPDEELCDAYFAADVLVFPVQQSSHDIEGFGMVALEAAAHGLPTVAFAAGGVPDAVSDGCCGKLIRPDDNVCFAQAVVEHLLGRPMPGHVDECRKFAQRFQWNEFGSQLKSIFHSIEKGGGRLANS